MKYGKLRHASKTSAKAAMEVDLNLTPHMRGRT